MPSTRKLTERETLEVADAIWAVIEDWFPLHLWPLWARSSVFKEHKDRGERRQLFLFLVQNGMEPYRAYELVMIHKTYDAEAYRSLNDLMRQWRTRAESVTQRIYDINEGRPI